MTDECAGKIAARTMPLLPVALLLAMFSLCMPAGAQSRTGWWGKTEWKGRAWVTNDSRPIKITKGLDGSHVSLWASHGRYYSHEAERWKWQRSNMFCTNEDLFTQTFVVPYLIPMLELAGANVFTPRERDWQVHETIIDNDGSMMMCDGKVMKDAVTNYVEEGDWKDYVTTGFLVPRDGRLRDGDNPFMLGTSRYARTTSRKGNAYIIYTPRIEENGRYAVYVSYPTLLESVDDAHYIVVHKGIETHFRVNQRMGGGTWTYLGTFEFEAGKSIDNCVIIDNNSSRKGVVAADAVRFGGGMGNIVRGWSVSGMPRCLEGARYYAQWAGAPYSVYSSKNGQNDYSDDINARSLMTNWLAGGSPYVPDREGKNVPIELSLALHSDAGLYRDMKSVYGSLGICTTYYNDERLASGISRFFSYDFAQALLEQVSADLRKEYGKWNVRDFYDRNYSETRLPGMPSAILELLSHQSFPDMKLAHDPHFKFTLSRAIYKTILRFISDGHSRKCVVTPLQPTDFSVVMDSHGKATISWKPQEDKLEPTAKAKSYILYTAIDDNGFDNGRKIKGTSCTVNLDENRLYRFRVSAVNDGGESFPSEEMAAYYVPQSEKQLLVVNAFHRLASPYVRMSSKGPQAKSDGGTAYLGFDIDEDPGVSYGLTAGWLGRQKVFSTATAGREGYGTFSYSGEELAGDFVAGNDFNYVSEHVRAIASAGKYSVVSCSDECFSDKDRIHLPDYSMVDIVLGNEYDDGYALKRGKTFSEPLKERLRKYEGALLVSGSYVATDNQTPADSAFIADVMHVKLRGRNRSSAPLVNGMGMEFEVWRSLNATHYASTSSDILGIPNEQLVVIDSLSLSSDSLSLSSDSLSMAEGDAMTQAKDSLSLPDRSTQTQARYVYPDDSAFTAMLYSDGTSAAIAYRKEDRPRTFTMGFPLECIRKREIKESIMRGILNFLIE